MRRAEYDYVEYGMTYEKLTAFCPNYNGDYHIIKKETCNMVKTTPALREEVNSLKTRELLLKIYHILLHAYGYRNKWFGDTRAEIIIGAILTQNTNWLNVEKSLINLRNARLLSLSELSKLQAQALAELIKPSGYHNQKAQRLIDIAGKLLSDELPTDFAGRRKYLLSLKGLGPETADCILLYADSIPVFVIDAYTVRIFSRLGLCPEKVKYHDLQKWFTDHLPTDLKLFQEYHALLIKLAKTACLKKPRCSLCPLSAMCQFGKDLS